MLDKLKGLEEMDAGVHRDDMLGVTELDCVSHHVRETRGHQPGFDEHLPSNVTVQQGDTAYLHCRIFNAENM